ncbi:MAG: hypothetical protein Q9O74_05340, partial [Planctomycetota bacterium]|nr:hypothetical protein [Planctomycetota bacterium]
MGKGLCAVGVWLWVLLRARGCPAGERVWGQRCAAGHAGALGSSSKEAGMAKVIEREDGVAGMLGLDEV